VVCKRYEQSASHASGVLVTAGATRTEGGRGAVTLTAYCATCERTVYVGEDDTPICPVCSAPLLATVDSEESETPP
jgi:hypothetical protein